VINAKGEIGIKAEGAAEHQKAMLESEGITFTGRNTIDLEAYRYHPEIF
jgi:methylated-DNA-protein-cysteine methyltransferase-like protein